MLKRLFLSTLLLFSANTPLQAPTNALTAITSDINAKSSDYINRNNNITIYYDNVSLSDTEVFLEINNAYKYTATIILLETGQAEKDLIMNESETLWSFNEYWFFENQEDWNSVPLLERENGYAFCDFFFTSEGYTENYSFYVTIQQQNEDSIQAYNSGYENGHTVGYNEGYNIGYGEGSLGADSYSWIKGCFDTLSSILNIEILPNMKIGYLIGIPFIILIVMFVLSWFR